MLTDTIHPQRVMEEEFSLSLAFYLVFHSQTYLFTCQLLIDLLIVSARCLIITLGAYNWTPTYERPSSCVLNVKWSGYE